MEVLVLTIEIYHLDDDEVGVGVGVGEVCLVKLNRTQKNCLETKVGSSSHCFSEKSRDSVIHSLSSNTFGANS